MGVGQLNWERQQKRKESLQEKEVLTFSRARCLDSWDAKTTKALSTLVSSCEYPVESGDTSPVEAAMAVAQMVHIPWMLLILVTSLALQASMAPQLQVPPPR